MAFDFSVFILSEHCRAVVDTCDLSMCLTINQTDEGTWYDPEEDKEVHTYKDRNRDEDIENCS